MLYCRFCSISVIAVGVHGGTLGTIGISQETVNSENALNNFLSDLFPLSA